MTANNPGYIKPLYPPDWSSIAAKAKRDAGWQCPICGIQQGEDLKNPITVHHKDHNTFNNDPSNLQVLCARHHLIIESVARRLRNYEYNLGLQLSQGQAVLPGFYNLLQLNSAQS